MPTPHDIEAPGPGHPSVRRRQCRRRALGRDRRPACPPSHRGALRPGLLRRAHAHLAGELVRRGPWPQRRQRSLPGQRPRRLAARPAGPCQEPGPHRHGEPGRRQRGAPVPPLRRAAPGEAEASAAVTVTGRRYAARVRAQYVHNDREDREARLDGSYVAGRFGNWQLGAGAIDRWWGPGWQSSLAWSNNARPVAGAWFARQTPTRRSPAGCPGSAPGTCKASSASWNRTAPCPTPSWWVGASPSARPASCRSA